MKRLRLVFGLLAALLWLPLLLLVGFALQTIEQEEAGRYKTVADRIFDEMERELTALLRREEERPAEHYLFAAAGGASPLQAQPEEPFVVAYFEVDESGALDVPHHADRAAVQRLLALSGLPAQRTREAPGEQAQEYAEALEKDRKTSREHGAKAAQSPGSTVELERKGKPQAKKYDVLSQLNRAVVIRERSKQVKQSAWDEPDQALSNAGEGPPLADERRGGGLAAVAGDESAQQAAQLEALRGDGAQQAAELGPLRGESAGERHLILVREARRSGTRVQQGVVLDLAALIAWLGKRVLTAELQRAAQLRLMTSAPPRSASADAAASGLPFERNYQHRFAQPFGAVAAVLALGTLPELEANALFSGLALLLLLTATLALYAGYRMVAAVVGYSERRNDFVSAVSHELKTPLTAIRMYGEMLRDDVVPDPQKRNRYYRIITAESERLTRLINNVLELSRIERGQRSLALADGDVSAVAREVLEVLEPHAREQGFELSLHAEPDLPAVRFDRDALAQVLFNLVDNALKYGSEAHDRTVRLYCERADDGVAIRVQDRGPGVARRHLRRIFEPFYRGERELTRKHKGTGIGLALVRGLVQRMGGTVTGRNLEPGFEVRITLSAADAGRG